MKKQMSHGSRSTGSSSSSKTASSSTSSKSISPSKKGLDSAVKSNMGSGASMSGKKSSTRSSETKRR